MVIVVERPEHWRLDFESIGAACDCNCVVADRRRRNKEKERSWPEGKKKLEQLWSFWTLVIVIMSYGSLIAN
jgi:hypothetical protein